MGEKLSRKERDRIRLHRKYADAPPKIRKHKSLEDQTLFDFGGPEVARDEDGDHANKVRSDADV